MAEAYEKRNFQSIGIDAVYESDVYPGKNLGDLPTKIVAIPNFSRERSETMMSRACEQYNARRENAIWLLGNPPNREKKRLAIECTK